MTKQHRRSSFLLGTTVQLRITSLLFQCQHVSALDALTQGHLLYTPCTGGSPFCHPWCPTHSGTPPLLPWPRHQGSQHCQGEFHPSQHLQGDFCPPVLL